LKNPAKAKAVTVAKGQKGDAGATFEFAPEFRLGVGHASSQRWGDGVRKKGEENNDEAGRRVIASHYRGAARLAGFMRG
jgi:hypothetical protein